jgi:O-acetyl-ADP-ribose deacetylase (regulator of RNase III)
MNHIKGDILELPENIAIAHCVGADLLMSAGVALDIKEKFGHVSDLKNQNKGVGEVATQLLNDKKYIFHLITKQFSRAKPEIENIELSLKELRILCENIGLKHIAMPRISSGHDKMSWHEIKQLIYRVFNSSDITIDVYYMSKEELIKKKNKNVKNSEQLHKTPPIINNSNFPLLSLSNNNNKPKSPITSQADTQPDLYETPPSQSSVSNVCQSSILHMKRTPLPVSNPMDKDAIAFMQKEFEDLIANNFPLPSDLDSSLSTCGSEKTSNETNFVTTSKHQSPI